MAAAAPAPAMMDAECPVCCASFTRHLRKAVECAFCSYTACAACVQQYLVSIPRDAQCMSCSAPWNREFVDAAMPRTWLFGAYKAHRERVLLEREMALLPSSQDMLVNYRAARDLEHEINDLNDEHLALRRRMGAIGVELQFAHARLSNLRANSYRGAGAATDGQTAGRRTFVRACPAAGCRGFLSSAWKCGVCDVYVCSKCHEVKGEREATDHVCDPGNLATAALLARDTKPCPKCAAMIHKVEGCDQVGILQHDACMFVPGAALAVYLRLVVAVVVQMYCTACNTAFSWRSGQIVTHGPIHNPHYYDFIRRTRGQVPRAPGDLPCGGLCSTWELNARLRDLRAGDRHTRPLHEFHRSVNHVLHVEMERLAGYFNAADNADLRLKYLLKEIDDAEWKKKLQQREKKRGKELEVRQIYEMYTTAAADSFRKLMGAAAGLDDTLAELEAVREFANDSLQAVGKRYGMTARTIEMRRGYH